MEVVEIKLEHAPGLDVVEDVADDVVVNVGPERDLPQEILLDQLLENVDHGAVLGV